uniref:Uncharacterized protein n=1 Tax=Lepeophtheirus salmonis TaxID=72036 RepID=A0A0K2TPL0_LEPSM
MVEWKPIFRYIYKYIYNCIIQGFLHSNNMDITIYHFIFLLYNNNIYKYALERFVRQLFLNFDYN